MTLLKISFYFFSNQEAKLKNLKKNQNIKDILRIHAENKWHTFMTSEF